ncbi:MAG TPA: hypothetical protein EYP48_02225 [Ignisphaera sp.]|nr:hypothetical protein [Ignisphaera sp.]
MRWRRILVSSLIAMILAIVMPCYAIPTLFRLFGIEYVKGLSNVRVALYITPTYRFPILILQTPDTYLVLGFVISGIAMGVYMYLRAIYIEQSELRRQLLEFIPLLASYVRTGATMLHALESTLEIIKPPLSTYVERFVLLIKLGEDPVEAFRKVFGVVPREVRAIMNAVIIAMVSGGRVESVLEVAERYVEQIVRMDELRRHRLAEYKIILVLAVVAFAIAGIVVIKLIESIASMAATFPVAYRISIDFLASGYFITSLFLIVISSIVMSRMITGSTVLAPKYISMLSMAVSLMYALRELMKF